MTLAENPLRSARNKHIDVPFLFIRFIYRLILPSKKIYTQFVASKEQHADIMKRSLVATPFTISPLALVESAVGRGVRVMSVER